MSLSRARLYKIQGQMVDFKMKYGERIISKAELEIWDNPNPERDYEINITFPEFTCLCPRSGYPDFASIVVKYVPSQKIVELKSLKLYLNAFRDIPISHEEVTNRIYSVLSRKLKPRFIEVIGDFNPRGNVKTVIRVCSGSSKKPGQGRTSPSR
jgi:7-cyano-7-deazaguanine reductase